ncbi:unnamed protein product, partial [Symbiodinium sp. CCMP2456]
MSDADGSEPEIEDERGDFDPPPSVAEGSEPGGRKSVTDLSSVSTSKVRVVYDLTKACTCCLCNAKSTDESPLDGWEGDEDRLLDGRLPWSKYGKRLLPDGSGEIVRVPEGRIDLICLN